MSFETENEYFNRNIDQIIKNHLGEFVAIKDEEILGYFKDTVSAIEEVKKIHKVGTFMVKKCLPLNEQIMNFHTRVG